MCHPSHGRGGEKVLCAASGEAQAGTPELPPRWPAPLFYSDKIKSLSGHNIEFSCPAASAQQHSELPDCADVPSGLLRDNCNDLLYGPLLDVEILDRKLLNSGIHLSIYAFYDNG